MVKIGEALQKHYPLHPDDAMVACCISCRRERSRHSLVHWNNCLCAFPRLYGPSPLIAQHNRQDDQWLYERLERHDKWKE